MSPPYAICVRSQEAEAAPGFVRVVTHKDVPGANTTSIFGEKQQVLFVVDQVSHYGQGIAIVLADTPR